MYHTILNFALLYFSITLLYCGVQHYAIVYGMMNNININKRLIIITYVCEQNRSHMLKHKQHATPQHMPGLYFELNYFMKLSVFFVIFHEKNCFSQFLCLYSSVNALILPIVCHNNTPVQYTHPLVLL